MRIEYEDRDVLVIYKEAGLPVQSGRTWRKDLVSGLKNHLAQRMGTSGPLPGMSGEPYLGIVHRLDQPVEGLLVFAKTPQSAARLSAQAAGGGMRAPGKDMSASREMEKAYQALVCPDAVSYPLAIEGMKKEVRLVDWLGRDRSTNMAFIALEGEKDAKRAELTFRTVWIRDSRALLEIHLYTGRHHQIRIQMAHAHMPILGDRKYGIGMEGHTEDRDHGDDKKPPLCLCASNLSFIHPTTKKRMNFSVSPSWLPLAAKDANMCSE